MGTASRKCQYTADTAAELDGKSQALILARLPLKLYAVASTDDEPVPSWVVVIHEDQLPNPKNA